jgi:hypothetical protein
MQTTNSATFEDRITIAFSALVILGLSLLSVTRWSISPKTISAEEKRHLEACPRLRMNWASVSAFPSKFEAFANDRFALRTLLIGAISKVKYKALGVSQNPDVLPGKNGWLFYLGDREGYAFRHYRPFADTELEAWARHFEARRAWLAQRNIKYLVYVAPAKGEIYPEFVPDEYSRLNNPSRQDQFLDALKRFTKVQCVDLRGALLSEKEHFVWPLYLRTDTHWNTLGAFIAYNRVASHLSELLPSVIPANLSDMAFSEFHNYDGDLTGLMGLSGQLPEHVVCVRNKHPRRWTQVNNPELPNLLVKSQFQPPVTTEVNDFHLPRAVFIRDSFMNTQQAFFSEHFRRVCYYWSTCFPVPLIEHEKPDIVVEEFVERNLFADIPPNPRELDVLVEPELFASKKQKTELTRAANLVTE